MGGESAREVFEDLHDALGRQGVELPYYEGGLAAVGAGVEVDMDSTDPTPVETV